MNIPLENIIPVSEARSNFSKIIENAVSDDIYLITRGGKPAVVIAGVDRVNRIGKEGGIAVEKSNLEEKAQEIDDTKTAETIESPPQPPQEEKQEKTAVPRNDEYVQDENNNEEKAQNEIAQTINKIEEEANKPAEEKPNTGMGSLIHSETTQVFEDEPPDDNEYSDIVDPPDKPVIDPPGDPENNPHNTPNPENEDFADGHAFVDLPKDGEDVKSGNREIHNHYTKEFVKPDGDIKDIKVNGVDDD